MHVELVLWLLLTLLLAMLKETAGGIGPRTSPPVRGGGG